MLPEPGKPTMTLRLPVFPPALARLAADPIGAPASQAPESLGPMAAM